MNPRGSRMLDPFSIPDQVPLEAVLLIGRYLDEVALAGVQHQSGRKAGATKGLGELFDVEDGTTPVLVPPWGEWE